MVGFKEYFQVALIFCGLGIFIVGCSKEVNLHVIIESSPPGANVFLDDQYLGITPLSIEQKTKKTGSKQKLQLVLPGYYKYQVTSFFSNIHHYTLIPHEREVVIKFNRTPDILEIDYKRYPPQKKITLSLSLGKHIIFAYKKNHLFLEDSFEVTSNSKPEFNINILDINNHNRLQIKSTPEEVGVYYRNYYLGTTPMVMHNLPTDPFSLLFKQTKYDSQNVLVKVGKGENRNIIARLNPLKDSLQIIWENFIAGSQITVNGKVQVPQQIGGEWSTRVDSSNIYHYTVSHPSYYLYQGQVISSNLEDTSTMVVNVDYFSKIPARPRKILETPISFFHDTYNTITSEGDYFFLSVYDRSEIHVYDLSFNHIQTFSFSEVGDRNSPQIMTGFQYPGIFLLRSRLLTSQQIYPFPSDNTGIIDPTYLLYSHLETENDYLQIAVFDNGDHRIKLFDFDGVRYFNSKSITARDYFSLQDTVNNIKREYLLPLRFAQAVKHHSLKRKVGGATIIFTDTVNRDIKTYENGEGQPGYFLSEFEEQPESPRAITTYHGLVLVGDSKIPKVWVYDQGGDFVHSFTLSSEQSPHYLFVKDNRLYAIGETASIYFLE